MPRSSEYLEYVLEQLSVLPNVVSRRMFGGTGLYQDEVFFALVFRDTLYFKVNDENRPDYTSRGMEPFRPYEDRPDLSFTYFEVPADVLEDRDELAIWARRSVTAAVATRLNKRPKQVRQKTRSRRAKTKKKVARKKGRS